MFTLVSARVFSRNTTATSSQFALMETLRNGLRNLLPDTKRLPSPRELLQIPLVAPLFSFHESPAQVSLAGSSCSSPALSCPAQPEIPVDTCCINYPAGHYLMTQFWDTSPPLGPDDSWTIHGLWPDYCNGGFPAFCDHSRSRSPEELTAILSEAAKSSHPDLLKNMTHYWLSNDHRNSNLWSHEWNKHGTCITTLEPQCYTDPYSTTESTNGAVLDYFTHTTNLFSTLNTHALLKEHDIIPSTSRTYSLTELEAAILSSKHAQNVTLRCNSRHELDEIWYHFIINGPLRNASPSSSSSKNDNNEINKIFIPVPPDGQLSNCPTAGVKYLPKKSSGSPTQPPGPSPPTLQPPSDSKPFYGKGHLKVRVLPSSDSVSTYTSNTDTDIEIESNPTPHQEQQQQGCLIRPGKWYKSGTCATYTAASDTSSSSTNNQSPQTFTLSSSFAPCAILPSRSPHGPEGEFVCSRSLSVQSIFSVGNSTLTLTPMLTSTSSTSHEDSDGDRDGANVEVLQYLNSTVFFAEKVPGRFEKVGIFADDGDGRRGVRIEVYWEGV